MSCFHFHSSHLRSTSGSEILIFKLFLFNRFYLDFILKVLKYSKFDVLKLVTFLLTSNMTVSNIRISSPGKPQLWQTTTTSSWAPERERVREREEKLKMINMRRGGEERGRRSGTYSVVLSAERGGVETSWPGEREGGSVCHRLSESHYAQCSDQCISSALSSSSYPQVQPSASQTDWLTLTLCSVFSLKCFSDPEGVEMSLCEEKRGYRTCFIKYDHSKSKLVLRIRSDN